MNMPDIHQQLINKQLKEHKQQQQTIALIAVIAVIGKIAIVATVLWWVLPHIDLWVSMITRAR